MSFLLEEKAKKILSANSSAIDVPNIPSRGKKLFFRTFPPTALS